MAADATDAATGDRFAFGENWRDFSRNLSPAQVEAARAGIERLLGTSDLTGKSFLDIGCGSGLMSLAAHQMGARVTAFDYDQESVATSIAVRDAGAGPGAYEVMQGSALDAEFVARLGTFDLAYSWGVLHHTGDMWRACGNAADAVASEGTLAIAIYNDQGLPSRVWTRVKKAYVEGGQVRRKALLTAYDAWFRGKDAAADAMALRHGASAVAEQRRARKVTRPRGMDRKHDLIDWVGGYPFEVAKPEEIFDFFHRRGFSLESLVTCGSGLGCNEYLFRRRE
jgi:SAM-dependent methyltransferase